MILSALSLLSAVWMTLSPAAFAYDDAAAEKLAEEIKQYRFETVTTKEGLKFSIPSDMPIERRDGLVAPIPFEEYLYFRFKKIEERMLSLEKRLDRLEEKLLSKLGEIRSELAAVRRASASGPGRTVLPPPARESAGT